MKFLGFTSYLSNEAPRPKHVDTEPPQVSQSEGLLPSYPSGLDRPPEGNLNEEKHAETRITKITPKDFKILKVLGKGSYGQVMLARFKKDGSVFALKILRKDKILEKRQLAHVKTEREVLQCISNPFIVRLCHAFQTNKKLYYALEYCPGGELFFHLCRTGCFSENRTRFYACETIVALEYLHKCDIIYRDLKPENILLDAEGHIRLTDFNLSKQGIGDNSSAKSLCGTPEYLAPEILDCSGHGKSVDWWSLGVLIYEMLTGLPPFYTKDRKQLFTNIRWAELVYPSTVSPLAQSLLKGLLTRNPHKRLGGGARDAEEIKCHPFFASVDWDDVSEKRVKPPFKPALSGQTDTQYFPEEFDVDPPSDSDSMSVSTERTAEDDFFKGFTYDGRDLNPIVQAAQTDIEEGTQRDEEL